MSCKNTCQLCDRLIFSQAVTFAAGVLTINIPARAYNKCEKYCIVIIQDIPDTTIIGAPVVITSGTGTAAYPLVDCCGNQVTAEQLNTRTRYATRVTTTATGGSFKLLCKLPRVRSNTLDSIGTPEAATEGGTG